MPNEAYDVFISYARVDSRHAADIDSVFRGRGLNPFFDRRNLPPGLPWVRELQKALYASRAAVFLIGQNGLGNTQQYERDLALYRQTRDPSFPIVPVILPEAAIDRPFNFLQILTWIDFSRVARVSDAPAELEHLLAAVQGLADATREAICPYRGLDAFREEDSEFFFGRGTADDPESPIGQLVRKVHNYPFVMVIGRSGNGKSSLVYAGLVPALQRARDQFWNVLSLRPGPSPLRALAAAFNPRGDESVTEYAQKIANEADKLRSGDREVLSNVILQSLYQAQGKPDRLLLYVDQWEELYAQALSNSDMWSTQQSADANRFIDLLLTAARTAPVSVVGTLRADFYESLITNTDIRSLLPTQQILLGSMYRSEIESTIREPARKAGFTFEPAGLVQQILDDVGEEEGILPLLQYALKETWALREGNVMSADSYARSGGLRGTIRITAERTFEALSAEDQQATRHLFLRLVTPGNGREDTRARALMPTDPVQRRIVEHFVDARAPLLVTGVDRTGRPTVEFAHEAVIRTWPRLRVWIDAEREKLRARMKVLQAKDDWEENNKRADMLLAPGLQLERARTLLEDPGDIISTDDIREFVALSIAREKEKSAQNPDQSEKSEYFISFAWGDNTPDGLARENIIDRLCEAAERRSISILRDKTMLGLGESISKFMERLARGNRVFIILSDRYLKSPYCMYELAGVWRNSRQDNEEFLHRICVFTLGDAKIWTPKDRALCAAYWRKESGELEAIVKEHGYDILGEKDFQRYRLMKEFAYQIGNILAAVTDILQPRSFEELERYGLADPPHK